MKIPEQCPHCKSIFSLVIIKDSYGDLEHLQCTRCDSTFTVENENG
jgi:transposase-like protein